MKVRVVGCSHRDSSVNVRERLALSPVQTEQALSRFQTVFPDVEAVLLSTCNRTEVYTAVEDAMLVPSQEDVAEFLAGFHGIAAAEIFDELFERSGEDAVRHLFATAASLDSMVVGETQILSQVKQAYELATRHQSAGPLTHAIFQAAVKAARRVATETSIHQKRVSIPSIAVAEFAKQIFDRFDDKDVLVLGAGEMAEETLVYLREEGANNVTIVNRSADRAQELSARMGGRVAAWESLLDHLATADVVVSTTGAEQPIVSLEAYQAIEARRFQKPLFVLDLAVPRDFDPKIGERIGVYLYSIDDLRQVCARNRQERDQELPLALKIIEQETSQFMHDLHHRATGPIIKRLREGWHGPKDQELRRLFNKLPELDDHARDEISQSFDRLINKLLHPPLQSLRDEAREGTPHTLLEALKKLFQIRD